MTAGWSSDDPVQRTDLENVLLAVLTELGWRRSSEVLGAAMSHETGLQSLDDAAMVLDLIDIGAKR